MSIEKMKKLQLLAVRTQQEDILRELMLLGCVEVSQPEQLPPESELAELLTRESSAQDVLRAELARLAKGLKVLDTYAPVKAPMFAPRRDVAAGVLTDGDAAKRALVLADNLIEIDDRLRQLAAAESRDKSDIESLRPWVNTGLSLQAESTANTALVFGMIPAAQAPAAEAAMEESGAEAQLMQVSSDEQVGYYALVAHRQSQQAAADMLREYGFAVTTFAGLTGTAEENIRKLEKKLKELEDEKAILTVLISSESEKRDDLKLAIDIAGTRIDRAETAERLMGTESAILLDGWVPVLEEDKLSASLSKYDCAWETRDPLAEETEQVPIKLKSNKLTEPLNMVTEMYSLPAYDGIDPNPLILPFFTVFFGIMFADMGYGLILILLGVLGKKLIKPRGTLKHMTGLAILCGITTVIFGFLFGGFFGDVIPVVSEALGYDRVELWSIINPLENPLAILVGALAIGMFQIIVGMAINAYMLIRDGRFWDAVFDVGSWWLLFAGIAVGALGKTWNVALAGVAAIVLTQGRAKKNIFAKLIGGIAGLYNITSYFGDVLSYARLMALLLATGVIASIINILGSMTGSIIAFVIIFILGHVLNMALNVIGTYVHAARLQYLEYFGKFYKEGGKAFAPLDIKTKYVNIVKEEY